MLARVRVRVGLPAHQRGHAAQRDVPPPLPAAERGLHHARSLVLVARLDLHRRRSACLHTTGGFVSDGISLLPAGGTGRGAQASIGLPGARRAFACLSRGAQPGGCAAAYLLAALGGLHLHQSSGGGENEPSINVVSVISRKHTHTHTHTHTHAPTRTFENVACSWPHVVPRPRAYLSL